MFTRFKNFLMQGDIVVAAVGFVIALAFSTLIKAFTDSIVTPLVNAAASGQKVHNGLSYTLRGQHILVGSFVSAVVYFVLFMLAIYVLVVVPYRSYMRRRGTAVFSEAPPTKTCPYCLSDTIPVKATRCKFCASPLALEEAAAAPGPATL